MQNAIDKFLSDNNVSFNYDLNYSSVEKYISIYFRWNSKIGISSITGTRDIFEKHFLDSFSLFQVFKGAKIVDIGSGGGFPGLALKSINNRINLVSIEKNRKRINFQKRVASTLGLMDVKFYEGNFEEYVAPSDVDFFVFRAVERREKIFLLAKRNFPGKQFIYMSSNETPVEIEKFDMKIIKIFPYELPFSKTKRKLFLFAS